MKRTLVPGKLIGTISMVALLTSGALAQPFSASTVLSPKAVDSEKGFGAIVRLDGDTLVVSAPSSDGGSVYVYQRDPSALDSWILAKRISPPEACDAVAVDFASDALVVGGCDTTGCSLETGSSVYIYERNKGGADNWGLFQIIRADFPEPTSHTFGDSVALGDTLLAIGDPRNETVRVYERASGAGGWIELGRLTRDEVPGEGSFGSALRISGDTLAVSSANYCVGPTDTDFHSEGVYTFERDAAAPGGFQESRRLTSLHDNSRLVASSMALEGPTLLYNDKSSIELHERDHSGLKSWGERQVFDWHPTFAVRGRTMVLGANTDSGVELVVRDRTGAGRTPWKISETLLEPGDEGARVGGAAIGPREVVVGIGASRLFEDEPRRVVIFHRDAIHADDFESGGLERWALTKRRVEVAEPGLDGSLYALEVTADGKGKKSFVRTRLPESEPMVSLAFRLDANDVGLGKQDVEIVRLSGGGKKNVRITLREHKGAYRLTLWARQNTGELLALDELDLPSHGTTALRLEWRRATGDGHANGIATLTRVGVGTVGSTSLQTDRLTIGDLRIGFPSGAKGTAGGSYLIDGIALHQ